MPRRGSGTPPSDATPPAEATVPGGDRGASPERTRLAWRRTSLVLTVVTVLIVRLAIQRRDWLVIPLAGLGWVGLLVVVQRRVRALAGPVTLRGTGSLLLMAAGCIALGVMGALLAL